MHCKYQAYLWWPIYSVVCSSSFHERHGFTRSRVREAPHEAITVRNPDRWRLYLSEISSYSDHVILVSKKSHSRLSDGFLAEGANARVWELCSDVLILCARGLRTLILGMGNLGNGGPWDWRTLGMADPGIGGPWEWRTLEMGGLYPSYSSSSRQCDATLCCRLLN